MHLRSSNSLAVRSWKSIFDSPGPENRSFIFSLLGFFGGQHAPETRHPLPTCPERISGSLPPHAGFWHSRFTVRPVPTSQVPSGWNLDTKSALFLSKTCWICAAVLQRLSRYEAFLVSGSYDAFIRWRTLLSSLIFQEKTHQNKVTSKDLLNKTLNPVALIFNSRKHYQLVLWKELNQNLPPLLAWTESVQAVLKPSLLSKTLQKHLAGT